MNELLLQGLSELGLDVSRAETLERFGNAVIRHIGITEQCQDSSVQ